jgi:aldose 1-epimerase
VIELRNGSSTLLVDEQRGGRLASLVVRRQERLVAAGGHDPHPLLWGSYPMVPYVGRVREGHFRHDGVDYQLPLRLPPHASHGTVLDVAWTVESTSRNTARLNCGLGPSWPWPARVTQEISLHADRRKAGAVRCWMSVEAFDASFPAQVGWHPWFADGGAPPALAFSPTVMYERDESGISTGNTVLPKQRPWDDCFAGVEDSPVLRYRDGVELVLSSDCDHWVVYEPGHALCVEPMSGPPNGLSLLPQVVEPGRPLSRTFVIAWG